MKALMTSILLLSSTSVFSAPFLICDPYPTNVAGEAVPSEFVVTISGIASSVVTPAVAAGINAVGMKLDLGPFNLSGAKTIMVKARNVWGESAASPPFAFTAGAPRAPGGIGLSVQ